MRSYGITLFEAEYLIENCCEATLDAAYYELGEAKKKKAIAEQLTMAETMRMVMAIFHTKKGGNEFNRWIHLKRNEVILTEDEKEAAKPKTVWEQIREHQKGK